MTCDFHTTTLRTCDASVCGHMGMGTSPGPHYADSHTSSHASARRISSQSARASSHAHDAVRDAHGGIAVRDEQHRAPLLRQRVNRLQNHGFVVGVEATRRLVEQHQRRVAQEDASQADALPFTL